MQPFHPARRFSCRSAAGFTILELLVVMGIIAVLVTLLSATIGRIFDKAKIITCASNERQLYMASLNYANDNNDFLPCPSLDWETPTGGEGPQVCWAMDAISVADFNVGSIWPYMPTSVADRQKALMCPSDTNGYARTGGIVPGERNFSYSYNANIRVNGDNASTITLMFRQVVQPAVRVMVYEEFAPNDAWCCGPGDSDDWLTGRHGGDFTSSYTETPTNYQNEAYQDIGRGNVCYFDGHVDLMTVWFYFHNTSHYSPLTQ